MVKNDKPVKIGGRLEPWVRSIVGDAPGMVPAPGHDAFIEIDGKRIAVEVKSKRTVDAATARLFSDMVAAVWSQGATMLLVIAESTTEAARETMRAAGIGYVDADGNAHLRCPGVYVHLSSSNSRSQRAPPRGPVRLAGKAGVVAQALVIEANRAWTIAGLAASAAVSTGLAHRVMRRLEDLEIVVSTGAGPSKLRRNERPNALLDLLVEEDREPKLRRLSGYALASTKESRQVELSQLLERAGIAHALTGTFAAAWSVPLLTSVPVAEIRLSSMVTVEDAWYALGARPVDEGPNIVLLQGQRDDGLALSQQLEGIWFASSTRIYLDALHDKRRGREQAEAYRAETFGF